MNSDPQSFSIPAAELLFETARSSGPGGQNVNKVETKVRVMFNLWASSVLSWEQKGRIFRHPKMQRFLSEDGTITVSSQRHRSQALNRDDAVARLYEILREALVVQKKRRPTKAHRGAVLSRLRSKNAHSRKKAARRERPSRDE